MKATIVIEGKKKFVFELEYDGLYPFLYGLADSDENTELFSTLASHSSAAVRASVASNNFLDSATVKRLAADPDADVLKSLLLSQKARECLDNKQLFEMIKRDVGTAEAIAESVGAFESADLEKICSALAAHQDPQVRNSLARNSSTPEKIIRKLKKDTDCRVRATANGSTYFEKRSFFP